MKRLEFGFAILTLSIWLASPVSGSEWYVTPNGTSSGDGSMQNPWDLATAIKPHSAIKPMDTVWMRKGVYRGAFISRLTGAPNAPVLLRAFPGERVVLDGAGYSPKTVLTIDGSWAWYWGLEVINSDPNRVSGLSGNNNSQDRGGGISMEGSNTKVINCIVHDAGTAVGQSKNVPDMELYGTLIYNNGWRGPDRLHGPSIYTQNSIGRKVLRDNILFNSYWSGLQLYGSSNSQLNNYLLDGNINFNGRWLIGGGAPAQNIEMNSNFLYRDPADLFYSNKDNKNLILTGNYLPVLTSAIGWDKITARNNTFFRPGNNNPSLNIQPSASSSPNAFLFENNTYIASTTDQFVTKVTGSDAKDTQNYSFGQWQSAFGYDTTGNLLTYPKGVPLQPQIFLRRNAYEPTRGHLVVYNWPKWEEVEVDLSPLNPSLGDHWELRNAQNHPEESLSGVFDGKPIRVKMTTWTVASPIGEEKPLNPVTFPEFGVFVVTINRIKPGITVNGAAPHRVGVAAPGAIVTSLVEGFGEDTVIATGPEYHSALDGVRVLLTDCQGETVDAKVLSRSPGRVTYAIPDGLAIGPVTVTCVSDGQRQDGGDLFLQSSSPSLFSGDGSGKGPALGFVRYQRGDVRPLSECDEGICRTVDVAFDGTDSEAVLVIMGTAMRNRILSDSPTAWVGGVQVDVLGVDRDETYPGLDWVSLRVSPSPVFRGLTGVRVACGQNLSNEVSVSFR